MAGHVADPACAAHPLNPPLALPPSQPPREVVGEDIADFEYTPKQEFEGGWWVGGWAGVGGWAWVGGRVAAGRS